MATAGLCHAQAPVPNFTTDVSSGCSPFKVNFTDQSTGSNLKYDWDLGNGTKSSLKNPSGFYITPGIYTIKLTVSNALGSSTKTGSITVYEDPKPSFIVDKKSGCAPLQVRFTDKSDAGNGSTNTSWLWDFGNGIQSTLQNPTVKYNTTGSFTIVLKVTNDKGCTKVLTENKYIDVSPGILLSFSNTAAKVCQPPFSITFNNTATGSGSVVYKWQFGDGQTSTDLNPTHVYQSSGKYSVVFIGTDNTGCTDTLTRVLDLSETKTDFTVGDTLCSNTPVRFTNASSPSPVKSFWEFSDGTTSSAKDPQKTFASPGTYKVKLTNTYTGCVDTKEKSITISESPVAAFTPSNTSNCSAPLTVNFKNNSVNADKYIWNFGDGSAPVTTTTPDISYTFTANGSFKVSLTAINNSGCTNTFTSNKQIIIGPPEVKITNLPEQVCVPAGLSPVPVIISLSPIAGFEWDFGDGTTSQEQFPSHVYNTAGGYTIKLTVTTTDGCSVTTSFPIEMGNHSVPAFTASPRDVCARDSVYFTNTSEPKTAQYTWLFGDGGSSGQYSPAYSYNDTGFFQVRLVINNSGCIDTFSSPLKYIFIQAPIARFSLRPVCQVAYQYQLVDESLFDSASLGRRTWAWIMPDGTTSNSQTPPLYNFPGPGTYSFSLTVSNGNCTHTKVSKITIVNKTPSIDFDNTTACKPVTINFKATTPSLQNVVSYKWEVAGKDTTTQSKDFSYAFGAAGDYTIKLTTIDDAGCMNSTSKPLQISGPKAGFRRTNIGDCKNLTATFRDSSKAFGVNRIVSWKWFFGDGQMVEKTDSSAVQHVYNNAGLYSVKLVIRDASGCADSATIPDLVKITEMKADWTAIDKACLGFPISFENTSIGDYVSLSWDFGDRNPLITTTGSGTYIYKDTGFYDVKLTIKDSLGCTDSLVRKNYIHISRPVASFFIQDSISFCPPFDVQFKNTSQFYKDVEWTIDVEKSNETDHRKLFTQPGTYDVWLKVVSPDGNCVSSTNKKIILYRPEDAKLTYDPLKACIPGLVNLTAFDNLASAKFFWDFGDGNILDTSANKITHTYNDLGSFTPKIILTESSGCVLTIAGLEPILIKGAKTKFDVDQKFFCDSGLVKILDSTTFNEPIVEYKWDFGDGTISNDPKPTHNFRQEGVYNILLTVKTESGCVDSMRLTTPVSIINTPVVSIVGDSVICLNERLQHSGLLANRDTSGIKWYWKLPDGNVVNAPKPPIQQYGSAGNFQIKTIVSKNVCADTAIQNIRVNPIPSVTLPQVLSTPVGGSVLLPALYSNTSLTYSWTPDSSLSCNNCPQPVATPKFDTKYIVSIVDSNGCKNKGEVKVIVLCKGVTVFLPNTFSPNSDGSNDVFYVRGQGLDRIKAIRVFNRWGEIVFEQKDFPVNNAFYGWTGLYKGFKAQPDVYVYQVEVFCSNSELMHFSGNVALIR